MRRNGDRGLVGGDREILDRGYGFHRTGDRWLPDRWLGMPGSSVVVPPVTPEAILTTWPDSSGKGHTASGVGSPILVQSVLNNFPVVRFRSASKDGFNFTAITMIRPSSTVTVMKRAAVNKILYALAGNGASGIPIDLIDADGGAYCSNANGEYTHWPPPLVPAVDLNAWHVITFHDSDSAYPELYVDGVIIPFVNAGVGGGNKWLNIGYNAIQAVFSDGDIAEIAIYNGFNRNNQDVRSGESYFGNKYGIATAVNGQPQLKPSQSGMNTAWWSASALWVPPNLADGDAVSMWPDSSGGSHHGRQATVSNQPILKKNVLNGKPVVRFNSTAPTGLMIDNPFLSTGPITFFLVAKRASATKQVLALMSATNWGLGMDTTGLHYSGSHFYIPYLTTYLDDATGFHVVTHEHITPASANLFLDGGLLPNGAVTPGTTNAIDRIGGFQPGNNSDGDIAEIIVYSGAVALRLKLTLLITTLLVTGQFPGTEEFDAMVGDRRKIKRYLHQHGAHPTQEQLDAVVTPMAAGDRANVEAYLAVKYGIPVASGGAAIDPAKVTGMLCWYKADSLIAASTAFDPSQIAGMEAWFNADAVTPIANGTRITTWPDSSGNGKTATIGAGGGPLYYANQLLALRDIADEIVRPRASESDPLVPAQQLMNKPALAFDGLAGMNLASSIPTNGTLFVVVQTNLYYSINGLFANDGGMGCTLRSPSGPVYAYNRLLSNGSVATWGDQTLSPQTWYVISNDSNGPIRINGSIYPTPYNGLQAGGGPFTFLGSSPGGNGGSDRGWVAEVIKYNTVLSDADKTKVEDYLKAKYGL